MSRRKPEKDGCEFCWGAKGGAPGNENVFGGHLACDYCTVLILDVRRECGEQFAKHYRRPAKGAPAAPAAPAQKAAE